MQTSSLFCFYRLLVEAEHLKETSSSCLLAHRGHFALLSLHLRAYLTNVKKKTMICMVHFFTGVQTYMYLPYPSKI
jgi:hypothetical protein